MSEKKQFFGSGKVFASNLKQLRKARGLTQEELGKALGVQKSCISNYEQNFSMPDIGRLLEIAAFFGITNLGQLVGYESHNVVREDDNGIRNIPVLQKIQYHVDPLYRDNIIDDMVLPSINLKTGDFVGFIIPDNSMTRSKMKKGDIAVIRRQSLVSTGDIILVVQENQPPILRKVFLMGKEVITLMPDSDDSTYYPLTLDPAVDKFEIVGKVSYVYLTF